MKARIAQLVEQLAFNQLVLGSSPSPRTSIFSGNPPDIDPQQWVFKIYWKYAALEFQGVWEAGVNIVTVFTVIHTESASASASFPPRVSGLPDSAPSPPGPLSGRGVSHLSQCVSEPINRLSGPTSLPA